MEQAGAERNPCPRNTGAMSDAADWTGDKISDAADAVGDTIGDGVEAVKDSKLNPGNWF